MLDPLGGGRLVTVARIGYRPEEYDRFKVGFARRGALRDELPETLLRAWTGEESTHRGRTVRLTPRPYIDPHPPLPVGGPPDSDRRSAPARVCRSRRRTTRRRTTRNNSPSTAPRAGRGCRPHRPRYCT
ncbi:hypothetical protein GCM10027162_50920 [Streptomyces incanus]